METFQRVHTFMTTEIEKRYRAIASSYDELKAEAEKRVVRWKYSNGQLWSHLAEPNPPLTTEEVGDANNAKYWFGYDSMNRVVCIRRFDEFTAYKQNPKRPKELPQPFPARELRIEYFIGHCGDKMEILRFLTPRTHRADEIAKHKLQSVEWVLMKAGRLQEQEKFREEGIHSCHRYLWDGNKLKATRSLGRKGRVEMEFTTDKSGQEQVYRVSKDGERHSLGGPLPAGMTVKKLTETIRKRLLETIPVTVKAAKNKEPVYCVALAYDGEGNEALPPCLGIGLESERNGWLKAHGKDAKHTIWNPAEFKHYEKDHTQLDDDELGEACEWLNGELENKGSHAPAKRLLVEVAAELNKLDWSKIAKVTPDFVVYAVDFELGDLNKNLKKIFPAKKVAALKAAKLL